MAFEGESFLHSYKLFVTKNPLLANEIEVGLKWASYIIAGRFSRSPVVTELIHSASKLLNLINDSILKKAAGIPIGENIIAERLQIFLTVLEHIEVFTEVASYRISGSKGKWFIVVFIELLKFTIRLLLLLRYDHALQPSPPISPLNRQKDLPQLCGKEVFPADCNANRSNVEVTFTLKSSKRVMRTLDAAPPLVSRSWKLPKAVEDFTSSTTPTHLTGKFLVGEILHISRPLAHLASMGTFGKFSWKPWFIALGLDLISLHLMRQRKDYNKSERLELNRRLFSLIVYLLRSPFYDQYSKKQIMSMLSGFADNVIGSGLILRPLMEYLPEWQRLYFYVWSS